MSYQAKHKSAERAVYIHYDGGILGRMYSAAELRDLIPNKSVRDAILRHGACGAPAYVFERVDGSGLGIEDINSCWEADENGDVID
jgi:hypothetical protein